MRRPTDVELSGAPGPVSARMVVVICMLLWLLGLGQSAVVARLPLPLGATPLVIVAVLALGYTLGPIPGALFGAWAGLGLDLLPPAAGPVGGWTLILTLLGAAMGRVRESRQPGPWLAIALVGVGSAAAVALRAALLWFAGATPAPGPTLLAAVGSAAMALLAAPAALSAAQALQGPRQVRAAGMPILPEVVR